MEKLFRFDIVEIAKKYNYSEENILILQNNVTKLKEQFPETYKIIEECEHRRDSRTAISFFQDLICSWLFEDIVLINLKKEGLDISLDGCSTRKIMPDKDISAESDFIFQHKGKTVHVELVQDYTGFWKRENLCDLRDNKIHKIKEQNSILLGIDMINKEFFICSNKNIENCGVFVKYHPIFKKPAFRLTLNSLSFEKLTWKNVANKLLSTIEDKSDQPKIKSFDDYFNENKQFFIKIQLTKEEISKINEIVNTVVPAKKTESHHIVDGNNEYKRFTTGYFGEMAIEKLLNIKFVRYSSGHSNIYNNPDISSLKIGVKTVEYGKFPIIFKKNKEPQIICVKYNNNTVYICGLATTHILNKYQSDDLILSPLLKARGTKTGFYGFEFLKPFKNLEELKILLKDNK